MLVTFVCDAHENITMFGEVAIRFLQMMGHSGTVPGAMLAKEVPAALAALESALAEPGCQTRVNHEEEDEDEQPISLSHRAFPLIQLLKNAIQAEADVVWNAS